MHERKPNRRWALIAIGFLAAGVMFWLLASDRVDIAVLTNSLGFKSAANNKSAGATKPICVSEAVPVGDCIPQRMANLPPDPGPAGMKTIEGIDADKDGVRDDVQRYIAANWGHSALATNTLTLIAKSKQLQVNYGDSLGREDSIKLAPIMLKAGDCYARTATPEMRQRQAMQNVQVEVTNTPERYKRAHAFNYMLAHNVYPLSQDTTAEMCGFDPAKMPN